MSLLNADSSPDSLVAGVRRANRKPLLIIGAILFITVLVISLVAMQRAQRAAGGKSADQVPDKPAVEATTSTVNGFERLYGGTGEIAATSVTATPEPVLEPTETLTPSTASGAAKPAVSEHANAAPPPQPPENFQQLQNFSSKKQQLFEAALTTKMGITLPEETRGGSLPSDESSPAAQLEDMRQRTAAGGKGASYADRVAEVKRIQGIGAGSNSEDEQPESNRDTSESFSTTDASWTLNSRLQKPVTPFVVSSGFVIPGVMVGGINSDVPGQIKGQVSQTVYDTATGRYPLIPQGSILVGVYNSDIAFGQERVPVAWQRIIFPDGRPYNISGMPGADAEGYSGLHDQVDHHWARIFGASLAMSVISAGYTLSQDSRSTNNGERQTASGALSESLGQNLGQTGTQITQKNLSIQPTNVIRTGLRFNIMVSKDIIFDAPYKAFSYKDKS
jgi:type IV secretion system protein VirB10